MRARWVVVAAVVVVGGCAKKIVKPPPEAWVELAGQRASFRQWERVDELCAVDPQIFQGDLTAMNALLAVYLERTSAGLEGAWGDEQIAVLEDSTVLLPRPLELERHAIAAAEQQGCRFEGLGQAKELNAMAMRRLDQANDLLSVAKARRALLTWKDAHPAQLEGARSQRCTAKAKPNAPPIVFHAFEDETGRLEWLFCDNAKVVATPGNVPAFEPGPESVKKPKKVKAPDPSVYLDAAAKFPASDVQRAPKVPRPQLKKKSDDAPEPDETVN